MTKAMSWMTQRELAQQQGVSSQTIENRAKAGTVVDGFVVQKRDRTQGDKVHHSVRSMYALVPLSQHSPPSAPAPPRRGGTVEERRKAAASREHESDVAWQRARREELEEQLEEAKVERLKLEQQLADKSEAYEEALREKAAALATAAQGVPDEVAVLVDAVWTALGEDSVLDMRDVLLLALRTYVEAT